jgi:hypothetical protein
MNNEEFFKIVRYYIINNLDNLNKYQLIKLLDIYKFNSNFGHLNVKILMESKFEQKINEKMNESEEEELKKIQSQ